ncbi:MAG: type III pantothenate kinase [Betaproteobacteria bacterium]|nr:type III pantothenate kinase [Betaproteobacteria bacterium]
MILALDIGNTKIKWGLREQGLWQSQGSVATAEPDQLVSLITHHQPRALYVANVSHANLNQLINHTVSTSKTPTYFLSGESPLPPLVNLYHEPQALGVDRWLSLFAARRFQEGPLLVVNSGTATTIDSLSDDHQFLGGIIIPGLDMMTNALHLGTANLPPVHSERGEEWPRNTANALSRGAIEATVGAIVQRYTLLNEISENPITVILSGGSHPIVSQHLFISHQCIDNLPLEGLGFYIDMNEPNSDN